MTPGPLALTVVVAVEANTTGYDAVDAVGPPSLLDTDVQLDIGTNAGFTTVPDVVLVVVVDVDVDG